MILHGVFLVVSFGSASHSSFAQFASSSFCVMGMGIVAFALLVAFCNISCSCWYCAMVQRGHCGGVGMGIMVGLLLSFSSCWATSGIGWLFHVTRWWMRGCFVSTLGDVVFCDVDGVTTLRLGVFSLSSSTFVVVLKISASCHNTAVCCGSRFIGACLFLLCNALIRSCAASQMVSPGPIVGILQCVGKFFANADVLYPFVSSM